MGLDVEQTRMRQQCLRLRAAESAREAAGILAGALRDWGRARAALVFLWGPDGESLVPMGFSGGPCPAEISGIRAGHLGDPVALCLALGRELSLQADGGFPTPSARLLLDLGIRPDRRLTARPLIGAGARPVGAALLADAAERTLGHELATLCDYGASVLAALRDADGPAGGAGAFKPPAADFGLVGVSPAMAEARRLAAQAVSISSLVFLTGPRGVGKETVAAAIHSHSPRWSRPFIKIDCALLPPHFSWPSAEDFSIENPPHGVSVSNLEKRPSDGTAWGGSGWDGATVFLRGVETLPLKNQARLLRLLERRRRRRPKTGGPAYAGGPAILVSANLDPEAADASGRDGGVIFRRLATLTISLPGLEDRPEDIPPLCGHFLKIFARRHQRPEMSLTEEALGFMRGKSYPGNLRDLAWQLERAVLAAPPGSNLIGLELLRDMETEARLKLAEKLAVYERSVIYRALSATGGDKRRAALALGIPRRTLDYKIKKLL